MRPRPRPASAPGLDLAVQLERHRPVRLLDLVRRVLDGAEPLDPHLVYPPDHGTWMHGPHGALDDLGAPSPGHRRTDGKDPAVVAPRGWCQDSLDDNQSWFSVVTPGATTAG